MLTATLAALATILGTSVLSGVLGMGGGIILMGVLTLLYPVATAMVVHGVAQLTANASRAALHRRHVERAVILPFLAGALVALGAFGAVATLPSKALVYTLLVAFPFVALAAPRLGRLDVRRPAVAAFAGVVVTAVQLLAGASGPVLDMFFQAEGFPKHAVVATKALTQAIGHTLKLVFYGGLVFLEGGASLPPALLVGAVACATVGTWLGGKGLARLSESAFRRWTRWTVLAIGAVYLAKGVSLALGPG